eukprot:COSAG06_NODE_65810_length_256_cov_0.649682_1_plen_32_part_10
MPPTAWSENRRIFVQVRPAEKNPASQPSQTPV